MKRFSNHNQSGLDTKTLNDIMMQLMQGINRFKVSNVEIDFRGVFPSDLFPPSNFLPSAYTSSSRTPSQSCIHSIASRLAPNLTVQQISPTRKALCAIVNTDPSYEPGTHWVAFFLDSSVEPNVLEFFDSYGLPPTAYDLKLPSFTHSLLLVNQSTLQSYSSSVCGHYCLLYLYLRTLAFTQHSYFSNYSPTAPFSLFPLPFSIKRADTAQHAVIETLRSIAPSASKRDSLLPSIIASLIDKTKCCKLARKSLTFNSLHFPSSPSCSSSSSSGYCLPSARQVCCSFHRSPYLPRLLRKVTNPHCLCSFASANHSRLAHL